ncbi:MAG: hypothetical protein HKP55_00865 [Gammaproteobacteria bacterium]|nr:hypothetical protein [Gammaproteobacteria bacterium]
MQTFGDIKDDSLAALMSRFGIKIHAVEPGEDIPGSHFGDSEAGLIDSNLYLRADTPTHSALHEACHYICMDNQRREHLHTDAGGGYDEENAVCYLQIVLAKWITGNSSLQLMNEMNDWGYTFRLGSALAWFKEDAEDAKQWLLDSELITPDNTPTWKTRH